jgi:hypothetical protein
VSAVKIIYLTRGQSTIVDAADFETLSEMKWCAQDGRGGRWAAVSLTSGSLVVMHRFILKAPKGTVVDHINGNSLDNRRENLRLCSQSENSKNLRVHRLVNKTSRFKGVCWDKLRSVWTAQITVNYKKIHIGSFPTEELAAEAYNFAAKKNFGEFSRLNT